MYMMSPYPQNATAAWFLFVMMLFAACSSDPAVLEAEGEAGEMPAYEAGHFFGAEFGFTAQEALPVDKLLADIKPRGHEEKTATVQLIGEAKEVCGNRGCWLTLTASDGTELRVTFKDYGFFVPEGLAGNSVALEGVGWKEIISIAQLRDKAREEGASEQEIEAITSPETNFRFEASGVRML